MKKDRIIRYAENVLNRTRPMSKYIKLVVFFRTYGASISKIEEELRAHNVPARRVKFFMDVINYLINERWKPVCQRNS